MPRPGLTRAGQCVSDPGLTRAGQCVSDPGLTRAGQCASCRSDQGWSVCLVPV